MISVGNMICGNGAMGGMTRAAAITLLAIMVSGCGIWRHEVGNRGGYADYVADKYWMSADTKTMRVLRAYVIQSVLVRLAVTSPRGAKDRNIVVTRMQQSNIAFANAYNCAEGEREFYRSGGAKGARCVFFDDLIVAWSSDLFALALASLSLEDGETFMTNITRGGLDTLQALFRLGRDAFALGREVGALYRDTLELEVVVWLDDEALAEETAGLREAYANGNGPLVDWKAELDRLKGRTPAEAAAAAQAVGDPAPAGIMMTPQANMAGSLPRPLGWPTPKQSHFELVATFIARSCAELVSDATLVKRCQMPDPSPWAKGQALATKTPAAEKAMVTTVIEVTDANAKIARNAKDAVGRARGVVAD